MAQRKLQEFDEYRYGPRSVLKPGDKFRVGGGPVYITDDGVEHSVADRGTSSSAILRAGCTEVD